MGERNQHNVGSLIGPVKVLLIAAIAVCLLSTLAVWVIGLPVPAVSAASESSMATSEPSVVAVPSSASAVPVPPSPRFIEVGQDARTETPAEAPAMAWPRAMSPDDQLANPSGDQLLYTVREGDTLGAIAQAHGVSVEALVTANDLADPDLLYVGQTLNLPDGSAPAPVAASSDDEQEPGRLADPSEPTPILASTSPEVMGVDDERWIDVSLSQQRLTAYQGSTPVHTTLVSTGLPATPTPVGQFRIWIKLRYDDMAGADYYIEDVPFVMYFHGGYGLHGVTWHANFGHPMSHGCVNLPTEQAEWLFNWADVGTLVNVHA